MAQFTLFNTKQGYAMKSAVAVIVIAILTVSSLTAQVHIKESTTIAPKQAKRVQDGGTDNHTIKFEFDWDQGAIGGEVWYGGPCMGGTTIRDSISPIIATIPSAPVGYYEFKADPLMYCVQMTYCHWSWKLFIDDSLMISDSSSCLLQGDCNDNPGCSFPDVYFLTPYFSTFDFSLGTHEFMPGNSAGMNVNGDNNGDCSSTWSPADPMTLTVVSGSQYVSFHETNSQTGTDTKVGSVVTTTGGNIGQCMLVADGIAPDPSGNWATIQAVSNGTTKTDSIQIFPLVDHFYVYSQPDTIIRQGWATLYVQAMNSADSAATIPEDVPLIITAGDSGQYGYIYDNNLQSFGPSFPYSEASSGAVQYFSDGASPGDMQKIAVTVTDANDPSKSGATNLFLEGDMVVQVNPSEISPGDTALIVVKQRNQDGSLSDFSPNQSFEVGIDSGSAYGTILSSGSTGGYFASIPQPFQFIAADSIGADSVMVSIRVGYQPAMASSTVPGGKGKLGQNMKAKPLMISTKIEGPGLKSSANKVSANTKGYETVSDDNSFTLPDYGTGWVEIKEKDECNYAQECSGLPSYPPPINVVGQPNGFAGETLDACSDFTHKGAFRPIVPTNSQAISDFDPTICINKSANTLNVIVPQMTINTLLDLCYQNLSLYQQVTDVSQIPQVDICGGVALSDLMKHKTYPIGAVDRYYYIPVLLMHEDVHMMDFEKIVWDSKPLNFDNIWNSVFRNVSCNQYTSLEDAQSKLKQRIQTISSSFLRGVIQAWNMKIADPNYEQDTQSDRLVQDVIDELAQEINARSNAECH
ncbi:MAG: hypothetical protein WAO19_06930 [Candidatus Kryptoniota bacterium]